MKKLTQLMLFLFIFGTTMAQIVNQNPTLPIAKNNPNERVVKRVLNPTLQLLKRFNAKSANLRRAKSVATVVYKSVTITSGGLDAALSSNEKLTVTNLTINGTIDARDFKVMRDAMPMLANIDISNVNIADYEGIGGTSDNSYSTSYPANEIPEFAFFNLIEVDNEATNNSTLTSILLPITINSIGYSAFALCGNLTSINIPASVINLGETVFTGCKATINVATENPKFSSLDGVMFDKIKDTLLYCPTSKTGNYSIPSGVKAIYMGAFYACSGLTSIELPASLNKIDYMTFYNCTGLTSLKTNNLPIDLSDTEDVFTGIIAEQCTLHVPYGLKSAYTNADIWDYFSNIVENPTGFLVENPTVSISSKAGSIGSATIKANIQWNADSDQEWLSVTPSSATGDVTLTLTAQLNAGEMSRTATITVSANGYVSQTTTVTQSGAQQTITVTAGQLSTILSTQQLNSISNLKLTGTIDASDFKVLRDNMPQLSELDLSEVQIVVYSGYEGTSWNSDYAANTIPANAFYDPNSGKVNNTLSSIVFPTSITSIDNEAFTFCIALSGVLNIPATVTYIGTAAFNSCIKLTNINLPAALNQIGFGAFGALNSLIAFSVSDENPVYSSVNGVLFNKDKTRLYVCPAQKEGNYTIPNTVVALEVGSFNSCKKLTTVNFPASVHFIAKDSAAFYGCSSLTDFVVNSGNPYFASIDGVLYNNEQTSLLIFPESKQGEFSIPTTVSTITSYSFSNCTKLTSLRIPTSVTTIESHAFDGNNGIESIYMSSAPIDLPNKGSAFQGINTYSCKLYVPYGMGDMYRNAINWDEFNEIIESPTGFMLAKKELFLDQKQGSSATVDVKANVSWSAVSNQSWLQISPANGNMDATLTVTAQANNTTNNRVATVNVSANGFDSQIVTILQNGLPKTITNAAGGLYASLTENERNTITNLKLKGTIDARDFKTMRDAMPLLAYIDLSEANIVSYEGNEGTYNSSMLYGANTIPDYAFMDLNTWEGKKSLRSFICPNSATTIGDRAFYQSPNLSSITFGWMMQALSLDVFRNCYTLSDIVIHPSNQYFSYADGVLYNKNQTTLIQNINSKKDAFEIPGTVTNIAQNALINCIQLTKITIPSSVTSIENNAFFDCYNLDTLVVKNQNPNNIVIGNYIFQGINRDNCILLVSKGSKALYEAADQWNGFANIVEIQPTAKNLNIEQAGTLKSILTTSELNTLGKLTITGSIDARDFRTMRDSMPELVEIDLSAVTIVAYTGEEGTFTGDVTYLANEIPKNAFYRKWGMYSINMPLSITSIADYAFYDCFGLKDELVIPAQVNSIGAYAFYNCYSILDVLSIPNSVATIGDYAFMSCNGITSVSVPASVTKIGLRAFNYCMALTAINVDNNNQIYATLNGVLLNKAGTSIIQCPEGVSGAFTIPSFVTNIEPYAFYRCSKLTSIYVKKENKTISPYAFGDCNLLTSISVDSQNPNYWSVAGVLFNKNRSELLQFPAGKSGIYSIPTTVTKIAESAFIGCSKLTSVVIPATTTSIGGSAFYNCSGLTSLTVNSKPIPLTGSSVFTGINYVNCVLKIPYGTKLIYAETDQWNLFTNREEDVQGFLVASNSVNLEAIASNATVNISANVSWATASSQSWLSVAPTSGTGNGSISISATANQSELARTATITVSATGENPQYINVMQAGLPKSVSVVAGNLATTLNDEQLAAISDLTLTGSIDARDFKTMRDKMPLLARLDISSVTIVAYTGVDGTDADVNASYPDNTIPDFAFSTPKTYLGKKSLTSIFMPSTTIAIGKSAFRNCTNISGALDIPTSVATIGEWAFENNTFTSVKIPASVTSIELGAFYFCRSLTAIYAKSASPIDISTVNYVFEGVDKKTCTLYVPNGSKALYKGAAKWQDFENIIEETTGFDIESSTALKVYPNPVRDYLTIEGANEDSKLSIIDLNGRVILEQSRLNSNSISLGAMPRGQYILRLVSSEGVSNFKITKQ